jgi:hypothetical protein
MILGRRRPLLLNGSSNGSAGGNWAAVPNRGSGCSCAGSPNVDRTEAVAHEGGGPGREFAASFAKACGE